MATPKTKARLEEQIRAALPPGESPTLAMPAMVKAPSWILPSALACLLFGIYGGIYLSVACTLAVPVGLFLGVVFNVKRKYYYLAATESSLVVLKRFTRRPVAILPITALTDTNSEKGTLFSKLHLTLPGSQTAATIRVDRTWQAEFEQLLALRPSVESGIPPA